MAQDLAVRVRFGPETGDLVVAQGRGVLPPLLGMLVAAGLVDWLVTRTLTRLAIHLPKSDAMIAGYALLGWVGQVGSTLAALLALTGVLWIARIEWQTRRAWVALALAGLVLLSVVFLVRPPGGWLLAAQGLTGLVLAVFVARAWRVETASQWGLLLAAAAMWAALVYQALPVLYTLLNLPGPAAWAKPAFLLGEALVVAAAFALWGAYGRQAARRVWWAAALPALLFAAAYLGQPAMTALLVVWSNGLTLYLPWWLYAAALWCTGVAVLHQWQQGERMRVAGLLLLAVAGYAPQLSSQAFAGILALWVLLQTSSPRTVSFTRSG